jgi:hypothetical protein
MIKIDNGLLQEIGLAGLPDHEKDSLLKHIYETLEMRVGMRLADQMTNQQLDEFEQYFEAKDDAGAFKWLESNFPNYKDVVQEEFDKLKAEVQVAAPQILAAAQMPQHQSGAFGPKLVPAPVVAPSPAGPGPAGPYVPQPAPMPPAAPQDNWPPNNPQPTAPQPPFQQPPAPASQDSSIPSDPSAAPFTPPASPQPPAQPYDYPSSQPPAGPGY